MRVMEVDIGCERSGNADTGLEIAKALQLNYVFFCEFQELHSPLRDAQSQGGGVHGNAFFSRFDIHDAHVIPHSTAASHTHTCPAVELCHGGGMLFYDGQDLRIPDAALVHHFGLLPTMTICESRPVQMPDSLAAGMHLERCR
ncbi:hypothetical protein WJX84_009887 [Apatococcus fuscideae]|uniref:Uncharacterized protein n=1 Tax=Apatococcus fuscideae TaxID=2026836 RepID=A0AAW1SI09_9CHLO